MEITQDLIKNSSPYISDLVYDIDQRILFIECVDTPESAIPRLRLVFANILSYQEQSLLEAPDDDTLDDVIAVDEMNAEGQYTYRITTYKKEITLQSSEAVFTEQIEG